MMIQAARTRAEGVAERGAADEARAAGDAPVALALTFDELLGNDDASAKTADDLVRAVREWRETRRSLTVLSVVEGA